MRLAFCGCGQPLWAPESAARGFCEHCRLNHCVHWPAFGYHPRGLPGFLPGGNYESPFRKADTRMSDWVSLVRADDGTVVIHRHTCSADKQVPWVWADTVDIGEVLYAAAYFGYQTCRECHPFASYDPELVLHQPEVYVETMPQKK